MDHIVGLNLSNDLKFSEQFYRFWRINKDLKQRYLNWSDECKFARKMQDSKATKALQIQKQKSSIHDNPVLPIPYKRPIMPRACGLALMHDDPDNQIPACGGTVGFSGMRNLLRTFSKKYRFLARIKKEHICTKDSLVSKLQTCLQFSFKFAIDIEKFNEISTANLKYINEPYLMYAHTYIFGYGHQNCVLLAQ